MILKKLDINNSDEVRFIYDVRCHPEVDKWLMEKRPANLELHNEYLKNRKNEVFYIIYDTKPVGYCNYKIGDEIEVGWKIHPDYQNKGYGTNAIPILIDKIKESKEIVLEVFKNNYKAMYIYKKAGFEIIKDFGEVYKMIWKN